MEFLFRGTILREIDLELRVFRNNYSSHLFVTCAAIVADVFLRGAWSKAQDFKPLPPSDCLYLYLIYKDIQMRGTAVTGKKAFSKNNTLGLKSLINLRTIYPPSFKVSLRDFFLFYDLDP